MIVWCFMFLGQNLGNGVNKIRNWLNILMNVIEKKVVWIVVAFNIKLRWKTEICYIINTAIGPMSGQCRDMCITILCTRALLRCCSKHAANSSLPLYLYSGPTSGSAQLRVADVDHISPPSKRCVMFTGKLVNYKVQLKREVCTLSLWRHRHDNIT